MKEVKRISFNCAGTTDPVRGERDGGILHIMRHYRPDIVVVFLSAEMSEHEQQDQRFSRLESFVREHWENYAPEIKCVHTEIKDASDIDLLYPKLKEEIDKWITSYPNAELLMNISSGTPQMQIVLSQYALDPRYHTRGIQVKSPEGKAGSTNRTNKHDYDVELELEFNGDEEEGKPNRCIEPKMMCVLREYQKNQVFSLLKNRNFQAASTLNYLESAELTSLLEHLAYRDSLQSVDANRVTSKCNVPFSLYPLKKGCVANPDRYRSICEYYLTIRNMRIAERYTDMVLRLNPFFVELEMELLKKYLPFPLEDIIDKSNGYTRDMINSAKLRKIAPDFAKNIERKLKGDTAKPWDFSMYIFTNMLKECEKAPADVVDFLDRCLKLNQKQRNSAAHTLFAITEKQITDSCGLTPKQITDQIEKLIHLSFPCCDPTIFTIYDRCIDYIIDNA